ncbi:5-formyltetrahydrofolate cyclo-ligase [Raoultibacter phocaeensis]|uniref:5-formyltetrahydrofolate cyclo-ligase n=1 Tax=Raoultibacter phocaeensis TaxID=2479841 RepID=UPI0015D596DF|nr:5-formyltetrahydrofolate cyclo-ligase [Raoultibacter phocaeensis]
MDKTSLRTLALGRRDTIAAHRHDAKCSAICAELVRTLDDVIDVRTNVAHDPAVCYRHEPLSVAVYQAMKSEVSISCFIDAVYERGMTVCFPCMMKSPRTPEEKSAMVFRAVPRERYECGTVPFLDHPLRSFQPNDPDLAPYPLVDASLLDLVIVPLVAFDERNNRLGYGGGNYDRLLPALRDDALAIGVAFEEQRLDAVPCDPHDQELPRIIVA